MKLSLCCSLVFEKNHTFLYSLRFVVVLYMYIFPATDAQTVLMVGAQYKNDLKNENVLTWIIRTRYDTQRIYHTFNF